MKRNVLGFILVIFAGLAVFPAGVYGQENQTGPIDLVLLLDTSTGMSSSYNNVNDYITGDFLKEFLRIGDTFHLVAFSQTPRLDVARRITSSGDVETIIARMMLQYPIERGSNIPGAIAFAEQYVLSLPPRPKKIVLVTTGGSDTENLVSASSQRLTGRNATIDFVRVTPGQAILSAPRSGRTGSGGSTQTVSGQGTTGQVSGTGGQTGTGVQGTGTGQDTGTVTETGTGSGSGFVTDGTVSAQDAAGTTAAAVSDSSGLTSGEGTTSEATGTTATDSEISGKTGTETAEDGSGHSIITPASAQEKKGFSISASSLPWIIGIILLLLLIIGLILLLSSRRLGSSPNRVMSQASSSPYGQDSKGTDRVDHSKDLARYAQGQSRRTTPYQDRPSKMPASSPVVINPHGPLLLNLFVEDQNTSIGKRNIHSLKSGYSLSVGGGKGDGFYIFLVPLPSHLGELRRNGSSLSFIPKKAKYFPDLGSNEVRDCLGKTIRVISDKNYELRFRFEMYEDPLIALNRMLNSIKVPG